MRNETLKSKTGIRRSLDIYFRDTARTVRMDALNRQFVALNSLVFDIGAHLGDRTASFLRLGASVVAIEPQPRVFRAMRLLHRRAPGLILLPCAVGKEVGEIILHLNTRNPTVATVAPDFIAAAKGAPEWADEVWESSVTVPVTTLDALITRYGFPDFVKLDVEGHEAEVLAGLSTAVPALSFEFTTIQRHVAKNCVERLCALGTYRFNLSLGEDHDLQHRNWLTAEALLKELDAFPDAVNSGDVYAVLSQG